MDGLSLSLFVYALYFLPVPFDTQLLELEFHFVKGKRGVHLTGNHFISLVYFDLSLSCYFSGLFCFPLSLSISAGLFCFRCRFLFPADYF